MTDIKDMTQDDLKKLILNGMPATSEYDQAIWAAVLSVGTLAEHDLQKAADEATRRGEDDLVRLLTAANDFLAKAKFLAFRN